MRLGKSRRIEMSHPIHTRRPQTDAEGNVVTKHVWVPLHQVLLNFDRLCPGQQVAQTLCRGNSQSFYRITLLASDGKPIPIGAEEVPMGFRFHVSGPGIDPDSVCRIVFPKLDCADPEIALVDIEMIVFEDE
jgi:hypothetical protein